MKKNMKIVLLAGCLSFIASGTAFAVSGPCVNCHTMHQTDGSGNVMSGASTALLNKADCYACHSGASGGAPKVDKQTNISAGGSFYWVDQGVDTVGHNVAYLTNNTDGILTAPPGFGSGEAAPDTSVPFGGTYTNQALTCAGTTGCHGTHSIASDMAALQGAHHSNASGAVDAALDALPGDSYRFLKGIKGYEDPEYEVGTGHNRYYGVDGGGDNQTISALCARCHGQFHGDAETYADGWIRHPTDLDLSSAFGSEYVVTAYDKNVPLGSSVVAMSDSVDSTTNSNQVVTCLSCHRAHGSDQPDLLRWAYTDMVAGTSDAAIAGTGCFYCHTTKDGI
ncbi:cytochrome c3 family protein [Desulfuromonas sp. AOP6]|uniref:cytochrome c3 family protein n=1 Tax=Desulfuromonas sp. AOP6 TaxID=1566351 RepID=UPI00127FF0B9|nr:cytochrome c3 family protein [Desulfuromonas sp. AOP6]BCA79359.1 cytochrome c [Desulfuromonas sp. AOP6]